MRLDDILHPTISGEYFIPLEAETRIETSTIVNIATGKPIARGKSYF